MGSVGVIIPAWNPGPFLEEALASLMAQTKQPESVVVVDDGSDGSVVVDAVAEYPTVRLMRQEQSGSSVARNCGAAATDSDFLLFLDADDRLRPEAIRLLGAALEADPALGMVHGRMFEFVDERYPPPQGVRCRESVVAARLHGSTLLRRSAWECVGPFDERLKQGEWIDWVSRAGDMQISTGSIDEVVLERRLHANNKSSSVTHEASYLTTVVHAAVLRKRQRSGGEAK